MPLPASGPKARLYSLGGCRRRGKSQAVCSSIMCLKTQRRNTAYFRHVGGGERLYSFFHVTQEIFLKFVYPFAPILFPVSWCSQDVAAGTDQSCSFEFKEDSSLLAYYSNNYHCLTNTNKQSIRKSKVFQNKHICQNLVILHLGGLLIGSMDFRWTGSVGFESAVIPGGQGVFWQADLREARRSPRKGTWSRWNVNHGERRTCVTKGKDGKHMSHFTLIYLWLPNPCQIKGRRGGGGATAKVEPFKVYLFDEDANSLIAFQTFRGGKRKPWRDWNLGLGGAAVHWQRVMCKDKGRGYW